MHLAPSAALEPAVPVAPGPDRSVLALGVVGAPAAGVPRRPGYPCGYPDLLHTADGELVCVLHTYPDAEGRADLRWLRLRDAT